MPHESNRQYGCYSSGIYPVAGEDSGHPCPGYTGYLTVMDIQEVGAIFKRLELSNSYIYVMTQQIGTGQIISNWKRIDA